jgi:hypothetical protein
LLPVFFPGLRIRSSNGSLHTSKHICTKATHARCLHSVSVAPARLAGIHLLQRLRCCFGAV